MSGVDHTTIIAGLTPEDRSDLLERSNGRGLTYLAGHLGAIALTGIVVLNVGWWLRPPAMIVHGTVVGFLFAPLHETLHRTPFRSRRLNDIVGRLCGLVIFIGFDWFRHFHLAHHRYTNQPGRDPELAEPRPETATGHLWQLTGVPDWSGRVRTLVGNALGRGIGPFVPKARRRAVEREARAHCLAYGAAIGASVATGSATLLWVWWLPLLMGGPLLRAYLLAEHGGCPSSPSMLENTRTVLTNALVRFFAWNMPYHVEHHVFPAVPFHKLPDFHRHTRPHLAVVETSYVGFNLRYFASLRRGQADH